MMNRFKANSIRISRQLHNSLAWVAIVALLLFVISALTHPLMVWTGPQSVKPYPPRMTTSSESIEQVIAHIQSLQNSEIIIGKVVPTAQGPMLQVTHDAKQPRQYYPLDESDNNSEYTDEAQAVWLAHYYSGSSAAVNAITFVNEFSSEYPWVNRLLPVYKVELATDDNLTLFVHTETNALAAINNDWKKQLQTVFQLFHTWTWLDDYPWLRVGLISVLLISLLTVSGGGLLMLLFIKRRHAQPSSRFLHRKLAWLVLLPFAGLLISALYHLLQYELVDAPAGMRLADPISIASVNTTLADTTSTDITERSHLAMPEGLELNSLTLLPHNDKLWLRASLAGGEQPHYAEHQHGNEDRAIRNRRFDGQASESGALFFDLTANQMFSEEPGEELSDRKLLQEKAMDYLQVADPEHIDLTLVKRFGPNYDFRNKRLPVWQITINNGAEDIVFIDPATGILVEHIRPEQQLERFSFSFLHKWNFLVPMMGRESRDIVVVVFLLLLATFGFLGMKMKLSK